MKKSGAARVSLRLAASMCVLTVAACSGLRPGTTPPVAFYSLDSPGEISRSSAPIASTTAPILLINPPHAAAGFDSQRILYVREVHKLEYFAHSEWVDPPARMLAPLLAAAAQASGAFQAVVVAPTSASGDLRLDTEIIRLQHEFGTQPSRVRFTLRAYLIQEKSRAVIAWREFEATVPSGSEDPYGGVVAANRAVRMILDEVGGFLARSVRDLPPAK